MGYVVQLDTNKENVRMQERRTESIEHILALFRNVTLADQARDYVSTVSFCGRFLVMLAKETTQLKITGVRLQSVFLHVPLWIQDVCAPSPEQRQRYFNLICCYAHSV